MGAWTHSISPRRHPVPRALPSPTSTSSWPRAVSISSEPSFRVETSASDQIPGYTTRMLDALALTEDEFRERVARANSDQELAEWLRSRTTPQQRAELNAVLEARTVALRINDADFHERYPYANDLPLDMKLLDLLEEDDRQFFAAT